MITVLINIIKYRSITILQNPKPLWWNLLILWLGITWLDLTEEQKDIANQSIWLRPRS